MNEDDDRDDEQEEDEDPSRPGAAARAFLRKVRELKYSKAEAIDAALTKTKTELRVEMIVDMMASGQWISGQTHRLFSKQWGISTGRIDELAAEANRVIRSYIRDAGNPERRAEIVARITQNVERLAAKAEQAGPKSYRDALEGQRLLAQLYGVLVEKHLDMVEDPFKGWTEEQLDRFARTGEQPEQRVNTRIVGEAE